MLLIVRLSIIKQPARIMERRTMSNIMYACIILHNMILENKNKAICVVPNDLTDPPNPQLTEEQLGSGGSNDCGDFGGGNADDDGGVMGGWGCGWR
ncbi:hypothetical protein OSB04_018090 [Centaurea solstitialis]|uniref:Nuclease HARBI1 n=1 Tax=Centaurea solstitialis TaxID=347529 RepID=A0AA38WIZ9_9ASTR|nr:hypothetical protein OSB04_018090 [Centaurea solstitialis]